MVQFEPPIKPKSFAFRAFGSTLRIDSNNSDLLEKARTETASALINKLEFVAPESVIPDRTYGLYVDGETYRLYEDGNEFTYGESLWTFIKFYNAIVRVAVGEHAESLVFLHAGVVGWREKAIVLPAASFSGKTTLVAELVKLGADYYSDEYAVIDIAGLVHPFERDLSVRLDGIDTKVPVASIGGAAGSTPLPVGMLLLTRYDPAGSFSPQTLSLGNAIVETVPFAIPVLRDPERTMKQLRAAFENAVMIKTLRGEASVTAEKILEYIESNG